MNDYLEHRRNQILAGRPLKEKKKYTIPKVSKKRQQKLDEQKAAGSDNEMDLFYEAMRKKMKDKCLFCGGSTMKNDDGKFHFSLAHLLPKAIFKSVATVPENIIELCFYNNSCHTNFDSGKISWEFIFDSKEGELIKDRLMTVLPLVAENERKHKLYDKLMKLVYEK